MDNESKKLNNAPPSEDSKASNDVIADGFYDLTRLYAKDPDIKKREEALRKRDEARRELEMEAIREDIKRRYSLDIENAPSNSMGGAEKPRRSVSGIMPEFDSREAVREELERIDEIMNGTPLTEFPEQTDEIEITEAKASAPDQDFDIEDKNAFYAFFYNFGDGIYRLLSRIFRVIFGIITAPFKRLHTAISHATENTKLKANNQIRATLNEILRFRKEIKRAGKTIKRALKSPLSLPSVIAHYFKKAFSTHTGLLKSTANILMPVSALLILIFTVNYWNGVTFALEVIYNDKSIGYISGEEVYIEAMDLVRDRLSSAAYSSSKNSSTEMTVAASPADNFNARYALSLVSPEELNDAQAISDKMIENSVDNLTHACGIYIDGEFICAVKNEADAKTVFYDILEPYEKDAQANGYVVGFAETIDYVQGLYRDDESVMWDASRLSSVLTGESAAATTYIIQSGDSIESVAEDFGVDEDYLRDNNPGYDWDDVKQGDSVVVKSSVKFISIKKIVSSSTTREIEFSTVKKRDATKYSGYRQVQQKGVNGTQRVTETKIYIDGILQDTDYSYETIKEPVDEIVTVGTRTSFNGVYIGTASESGFLWPAPSCHYVSSPYGWRSSGWHNGIDLVKSGGGALGTPVIASKSGRVEVVQRSNSGYGNMVLINHGDGYKTRYAHMIKGSITVSVGEYVEAGQTIGKVGSTGNSTGPHLHFEVIVNGETQNPKNYIS